MSRPGAWGRVWMLIKQSFKGSQVERKYIAKDPAGNRYYEIVGTKQNVKRGYEPASPTSEPPVLEWQAWLKGTRRFPPSDEEIQINRLRQQAQRIEDSKIEKEAPRIESTGRGAGDTGPKPFPKYDDFEYQPGVSRKSDKSQLPARDIPSISLPL
ncbi:hypothetical protein Tcan_18155 [Toxocara canis]|uniref:Mimitin, mitochondrial n=1 Tax=Toxocara canis TaxID=6265 RepID=A0A0B2VII9_TOXCA|nr:hypothetical protein Tcan_18155 [Toxocara canis]